MAHLSCTLNESSIHFTLSSLERAGERHSLRYDNARGSGGRVEEHAASGASAGHEASAAGTDAPDAWRALDAHVSALGQPDADGWRPVVLYAWLRAWLHAWRLSDGGPLPARQCCQLAGRPDDRSSAASAASGSASAATAVASPSRGADAQGCRASSASRASRRARAAFREASECGRAADACAAARAAAQAAQGGASFAAVRAACRAAACAGSAAAAAAEARGAGAAAQS